MSELVGADSMRRRLLEIQKVGSLVERRWQDEAARAARSMVPVRTGALRSSIRPGRKASIRRGVTAGGVLVVGSYTANFIDAGSKAHQEPRSRLTKTGRLRRGKAAGTGKVLKFEVGGQTFFRSKVEKRAIAARPFKHRATEVGFEKVPFARDLVALWEKG